MHTIQVYINNVVVFSTPCRPDISMMKAHHCKRIYMVEELKRNSIDAGVCVLRDDGAAFDAAATKVVGEILVLQSKMNNENFKPDE